MRRCRIAPTTCHYLSRPCCKDCERRNCAMRCQNSPEFCNCWEEGSPTRKRGKGGGYYLDWDEIARLRGQGLTIAEIAERQDCSIQGVHDALKKREVCDHAES